MIRQAAVQFISLGRGQWYCCAVRSNAIPNLFHERDAFLDTKPVYSERFH